MTGTSLYWVVRCQPAKTLSLVGELEDMGFEVWSPSIEREYRKARSKKFIKVTEPIIGGFLFVAGGNNPIQCAERLGDLSNLLGIRVMRENGRYAQTSPESLEPLRELELEARTRGSENVTKINPYAIGMRGTVDAIAFAGLTCSVVGAVRKKLIVVFDDHIAPVEIRNSLFRPEKI